jgi:hypothetical protein
MEPGLQYIQAGIQEGQFKPVVERTFLLEQIVEAYRYMKSNQQMSREGQHRGCAPLSDSMKHCIMAIAVDSALANVYHLLLGHSFSVQPHSGA